MELRFLGKDSSPQESSTLYATDQDSYIVQGWIVTDADFVSTVDTADDETIVEVPARRVSDPGALDRMRIPDHETCVEVSKAAMVALLGGR
jgi:hypothetical protein